MSTKPGFTPASVLPIQTAEPTYKQARFSSFSKGLKELCDMACESINCTEVCMESTGKYWIPVFNVLEKRQDDLCHSFSP